ncbi:MAG TPA: hypothetical protein VF657_14770 [Actinoplanes sp.]
MTVGRPARWVGILAIAMVLSALAMVGAASWPGGTPAAQANQASIIETGSADPANVRPCPSLPNAGVTTGECASYAQLANGTQVTMLCWAEGNAPPNEKSRKWFWVRVVDGPNAGVTGYVWSDLVSPSTQIPTPECTDATTTYAQPSVLPSVQLQQGAVAPAGYRYDVSVTNFPAYSSVAIDCYDSWSTEPFYSFTLTTDGLGNARSADYCFSADGPDHWVTADGMGSNSVVW